jgi:hypothetical protein
MDWMPKELGFDSWQGKEISLLSTAPQPALGTGYAKKKKKT